MATIGERIRDHRTKCGLSQRQLADGIVSPSYISLIEAGKRLPEPPVLDAIAYRLGTTAMKLSVGEHDHETAGWRLGRLQAELAIASGRPAEALEFYTDLITQCPTSRPVAEWGIARALEADGRAAEAIPHVEWLIERHETDDTHEPGLLPLLDAQCRLYLDAGDVDLSITLGERALARIHDLGLDGHAEEVRIAVTLIDAYLGRGDRVRAMALAEQTVGRATAGGSRPERSGAYWAASRAALSAGRTGMAISLASRAVETLGSVDDDRQLGRLQLSLAAALLAGPDTDLARCSLALDAARAALTRAGVVADLARCSVEQSRLWLRLGDTAEALVSATDALSHADLLEPAQRARAHLARGRALAAAGDPPRARQAALEATRVLAGAGRRRADLAAWREAAELFAAIGCVEDALDAYRNLADGAGTTGEPVPRPRTATATVAAVPQRVRAPFPLDDVR